MTTMLQFKKAGGGECDGEPLHYKACGLDYIYLANGFTREMMDGEEYVSIEDLDGLWKAIGLYLITTRKELAPREIRFLRDHMDMTQAELGKRLRVSDQTVARWEKGETNNLGPADLMLRVFFLASEVAQPEGKEILEKVDQLFDTIIDNDEPRQKPTWFRHGRHQWRETKRLKIA
jgi:DNA-binding transcriptional regulator YiaG